MKTNKNKLMKTNKPNTWNHMRKHRTTCNEVKFRNDANNADAELKATCEAWLHYCIARFIVQREVTQIIITSLQFFFSNDPCWKCCVGTVIYDQCGKTIVREMMDAGINNVIYMELNSGPKMANGTCGNDRSRFHCTPFIISPLNYIRNKALSTGILPSCLKYSVL